MEDMDAPKISLACRLVIVFLITFQSICQIDAGRPPNIVFILADDLGWNDVGFNNPDIISPNLDKLAKEGIILDQSYVQPLCSPSRSALMTGVYPFRLGLQHFVISQGQSVCAPLNRPFLPQVLKDNGYDTHMIGKWHLGFCNKECTPTYRGFDSFYGFYTGVQDYYDKTLGKGYDFREDENVNLAANGTYSTYLYSERVKQVVANQNRRKPMFLYLSFQSVHTPIQVPQEYASMYLNIRGRRRRNFSGMVTAMDDTIGELVKALKEKRIYDDTLFVFTGDNGGYVLGGGNNYPLRGGKSTVFEGGTRAAAFVHGPMFRKTGVRYSGLIHMVDWFPTLLEAADVKYSDPDQDGVSQWRPLLFQRSRSNRNEIVYNIDFSPYPVQGRSAIRIGDYKLIDGYPGPFAGWYKPGSLIRQTDQMVNLNLWQNGVIDLGRAMFPNATSLASTENNILTYKRLFNVKRDPYERRNLYWTRPLIVRKLKRRLDEHAAKYVTPMFPLISPRSRPKNYGGTWSSGWC